MLVGRVRPSINSDLERVNALNGCYTLNVRALNKYEPCRRNSTGNALVERAGGINIQLFGPCMTNGSILQYPKRNE